MLEPCVREYPIHSSKDVGQLAYLRVLCRLVGAERESRGEVLRRCEGVCGPIESVAAVVDCAAGLWRVVDSAEVLPLGSAHLGTCDGRARRRVRKQGDDDRVDLLREEPAQLVQPQRLVNILWRLRQLQGHVLVHRDLAVCAERVREEVVQRFEVLGELEGRINLRVVLACALLTSQGTVAGTYL